MKVNKSQAMMLIFKNLFERKYVCREEILDQIEITELTFRRYMQEVRAFFYNFYLRYKLVYSKKDDCYFLENDE